MSNDKRWELTIRRVEPNEHFSVTAMFGHNTFLPTPWVAVLYDAQGSSYGSVPDKWTYHFGRNPKKAEKRARKYIEQKEKAEASVIEVEL
jgi:hypothetical protein